MHAPVGHLVQIVPRLGPFDGVGDYALRLAEQLRDHHALPGSFIEAGTRQGDAHHSGVDVFRCQAGSAAALAAALVKSRADSGAVLLHYVGYGYADRGAPMWLARAIARARRAMGFRLGVVFHELYATGRPWQSSFWFGGLQKLAVRRVAHECHGALLTREGNRQWLDRTGLLAGKRVEVLPVPSGVGEPADVLSVGARERCLVVWGSTAMKEAVYRVWWPQVIGACRALGIESIADIGARFDRYPGDAAVKIESHGRLPAGDVSRILAKSRAGLLVYPASFLAKSTLFAAFAAHGVVSLVLDDAETVAMDGLVAGRQFLHLASAAAAADSMLDAVAVEARAWYSGHTSARHAAAVWALLHGAEA